MRPRTPFPASLAAFAVVSLLTSGCGGGAPTTAAIRPSGTLAYVRCMRSNRVPNFPDPTSSGEIPKDKVVALVGGPQFLAAQRACQHFMPTTGLGPQQTAQQMHTRFANTVAFSRCIRRHGFPTFPDPTSSGELTHEMLANAGINLDQPAALHAGDACASVTHGVITKISVASFIAGH